MTRPDVPRYYRISTRFWDDEKSRGWPTDVKLLVNRTRFLWTLN